MKIAINSSYGLNGNIEYGDVNDISKLEYNINNIEGINSNSRIERNLVSDDFPLTIYIDGYGFIITEKGKVSKTDSLESYPNVEVGLISDNEYKINNTILTFDHIVTVGVGQSYASIKGALDYLCDNGFKNNVAIILKSGTYPMQDIQTGTSYNINIKYDKMDVSIIADEPGKVFINGGEYGMTENGAQYAISLKFYRTIFIEPIYGHGFHLDMDSMQNEYYNCVFNAPIGGWNGQVSTCSVKIVNSIFIKGSNSYYSSNPIRGLAQNCASTNTVMDPVSGTKTTCLTNATVDSNFNITSAGWKNSGTGINSDGTVANIGVYGGNFAWNKINLAEVNNYIEVDLSALNMDYSTIRYMYGTTNVTEIINDGKIIKSDYKIPIIGNGAYTVIIMANDNIITRKTIFIEGKDINTEYTINNTKLSFKRIVKVGADEECTTVKQAFDVLCDKGYKSNGAILLKEGSYDTQDLHTGNSYAINSKFNGMTTSIIADSPGKTFMTSGEMAMAQNGASYWIKLSFYRIIFKNPVYSDVGSNGFHLNDSIESNKYYNCVFLPPVGGYNGSISTSKAYTYNCLFAGGANTYYTNYPISGEAKNCASINTVIDPASGTKTTCLTNATIDTSYNITSAGWKNTGTGTNPDGSQANIGVYGGDFSW